MQTLATVALVIGALVLVAVLAALKIVKQYKEGVLFRLGRLGGERGPGLRVISSFIDVLHRVLLRIVTMPIQSQGIITRRQRQRRRVRRRPLQGRRRRKGGCRAPSPVSERSSMRRLTPEHNRLRKRRLPGSSASTMCQGSVRFASVVAVPPTTSVAWAKADGGEHIT